MDSEFQVVDSSLDLGFLIPIATWIPDSASNNFPDSGIRIPLHVAILV